MIKRNLVDEIVAKTHISEVKAEQALDTVLGHLKASLAQGRRIELRKIGVFTVAPKRITKCRNPKTGAAATVKPGRVVRFKASQKFDSTR